MGLIVTAVVVAVSLIRKEKLSMPSRSDEIPVSFLGSGSSPSGLKAVTEITYEDPERNAWPYLSVSIFGQNGGRLYQSPRYAAWFEIKLCWDDAERLWIASTDIGTDVIAAAPDGWHRHRWLPEPGIQTMLDAETGERLRVVNWIPPHGIRAGGAPG